MAGTTVDTSSDLEIVFRDITTQLKKFIEKQILSHFCCTVA